MKEGSHGDYPTVSARLGVSRRRDPDRAHARRLGVRLRSAGTRTPPRVRRVAGPHRLAPRQGAALSAAPAARPARHQRAGVGGRSGLRCRPARRAVRKQSSQRGGRGLHVGAAAQGPAAVADGARPSSRRRSHRARREGAPLHGRRDCGGRADVAAARSGARAAPARHGRVDAAAGARGRQPAGERGSRSGPRPTQAREPLGEGGGLTEARVRSRETRRARGAGARGIGEAGGAGRRPSPPQLAAASPGVAAEAAGRPAANQELVRDEAERRDPRGLRRSGEAIPGASRRATRHPQDDGPGQRPDRGRRRRARQSDLVHVRRPAVRRARSGAAPAAGPRRDLGAQEGGRAGGSGRCRAVDRPGAGARPGGGLALRRQPTDVQPRGLEHPRADGAGCTCEAAS